MLRDFCFKVGNFALRGFVCERWVCADICFASSGEGSAEWVIGDCSLLTKSKPGYALQDNGLYGRLSFFGDAFSAYVCDYGRYCDFVRCVDELNEFAVRELRREQEQE